MILDARNGRADLNRTDQICIVGAGPAGLTLARELASVASVLLVESGGFETNTTLAALQVGDVAGIEYPLTETRARQFGGSSDLWAGYCALFDAHDFSDREWVPESGWPFAVDQIEPFYKEAAKLLNIGAPDFDAQKFMSRGGIETPFHGDDFVPTVWRFGVPKMNFGAEFRDEFENSENITTLTHANVVDIRLDSEHAKVEEIIIRTLDGREGRIAADVFVLACGGIETARIMLNADSQVSCGLGNESDMVGRCFMEHPHITLDSIRLNESRSFRGWLNPQNLKDGSQFLCCIGTSPRLQSDMSILNARAHIFRTPQMSDDEVPRVGAFLEQAPNRGSRVMLSDRSDSLGMRRISLDWRLTDLEWRTFEHTSRILGSALKDSGAAQFDSKAVSRRRDSAAVLYSNHHLGTTRISHREADGVVNADCRVHNYENLYVAGGGVFSTVSWANPTFTLMALVFRLASHLRTTLN